MRKPVRICRLGGSDKKCRGKGAIMRGGDENVRVGRFDRATRGCDS